MKKFLFIFSILFFAFFAKAQSILVIEPTALSLDEAIEQDANRPADRVYVLKRNTPYVIRKTILNTNFHLRIRAEAGTGARPIIVPTIGTGGATPEQVFEAKQDITLEGLHITGRNTNAGYANRGVRATAENIRVNLKDCLFDDIGQAAIRTDAQNTKLYIFDCIFSRSGRPFDANNGRMIDARGNIIDSTVIENCLIYNTTSRVFRDDGPATPNNYMKFNQNTVVNCGQNGFDLGKVGELIFTNNVVQNVVFYGTPKNLINPVHVLTAVVDTASGKGTTKWVITNNNISEDLAVANARVAKRDTFIKAVNFSPVPNAVALKTTSEIITFKNPPVLPIQFINDAYTDIAKAKPWDTTGLAINTVYVNAVGPKGDNLVGRYSETYNVSYGTWRPAHKGGTTGQPLGANLFGFSTSTPEIEFDNNTIFYPNPVENRLFIQNSDKLDISNITVFNISGAAIKTVNNIKTSLYELNLSDMTTGVYIVKVLKSNGKVSVSKVSKQ